MFCKYFGDNDIIGCIVYTDISVYFVDGSFRIKEEAKPLPTKNTKKKKEKEQDVIEKK